MKKLFLSILACLPLLASAQTYDTIYNRAENCYYTSWYDTCECFLKGQRFQSLNVVTVSADPNSFAVYPAFTPTPMEVKGVMLFVLKDIPRSRYYYDYRLPEYALLYQYDAVNDSMIFIDSARWDTVTPKIMKWPQGADTALRGFYYCYAYEAYFDKPIMVDSTFYVGGTQHSNTGFHESGQYLYKYVEYERMITRPPCGCEGVDGMVWAPGYGWDTSSYTHWIPYDGSFGGFLPIVDKYRLDVEANNPHDGTVEGSGLFPNLSYQTITAVPLGNNRFLHWDDGDTTNPRTVQLTQDTLFTAYFSSNEQHTVRAIANDNWRGRVDGGGIYYLGEVAELSATPYEPYFFARWDDGDTANPRQIVVAGDTVLTALFLDATDTTGITPVEADAASFFTLTPNPTTGKVTVTVGILNCQLSILNSPMTLTLRDAAGHEVLRKALPAGTDSVDLDLSHLPAGAYFVTLATPASSATQRLVVK